MHTSSSPLPPRLSLRLAPTHPASSLNPPASRANLCLCPSLRKLALFAQKSALVTPLFAHRCKSMRFYLLHLHIVTKNIGGRGSPPSPTSQTTPKALLPLFLVFSITCALFSPNGAHPTILFSIVYALFLWPREGEGLCVAFSASPIVRFRQSAARAERLTTLSAPPRMNLAAGLSDSEALLLRT